MGGASPVPTLKTESVHLWGLMNSATQGQGLRLSRICYCIARTGEATPRGPQTIASWRAFLNLVNTLAETPRLGL